MFRSVRAILATMTRHTSGRDYIVAALETQTSRKCKFRQRHGRCGFRLQPTLPKSSVLTLCFGYLLRTKDSKMKLHWSVKSIPELKGLAPKDRMALIQPVLGAVWRRWQVWLPVLVQAAAAFSFIFYGPHFQYRIVFVVVAAMITAKIAFLPYHYFLALEIERGAAAQKAREQIDHVAAN
jgi:hypothetical protein